MSTIFQACAKRSGSSYVLARRGVLQIIVQGDMLTFSDYQGWVTSADLGGTSVHSELVPSPLVYSICAGLISSYHINISAPSNTLNSHIAVIDTVPPSLTSCQCRIASDTRKDSTVESSLALKM